MPEMPVAAPAEASVLDQVEILRPLPPQLKQQLEARLVEKQLKAGTLLFNEGDPGDSMYLIVAGEVSVYLSDKSLGLNCELARLGSGQSFGEMALVTGSPRSASVKATEDCRLLVLSRDILFKLVQAAPQVGLMIAAVLAKRTEELNKNQWLEFGTLKGRTFDPTLAELIPLAVIKRLKMVPVARANNSITVATCDPSNKVALEDVRSMLHGEKVRVLAVSEADLNAWIQTYYSGAPAAPERTQAAVRPSVANLVKQVAYFTTSDTEDTKASAAAANAADVALLLTTIIVEGIDKGASDIHFDPERKGVVVRYRVDGLMQNREALVPRSLHGPLMSRIKVLASLNITEKRLPQDGRISFEMAGRNFDLRVATIATKYGEKATLRILDSASINQQLGSLIAAEKVATVVRKMFAQPNGLVLVTGPTGSGKTTTLYSALRERLNQQLAIATVEDPVEYDLPGVTQVQVNEPAGLGFPEVLRAFLRSNPDVIFVGEMRDQVTAKLACQAALTGHMVLSSMHTNDAISSVVRLQSIGVEPYVIASSLAGVVNQRLVRRVCPSCRTETPVSESVVNQLRACGVPVDANTKFYRGKKCATCNGEGFKGRVGVYELLVVSQKVKDAISANVDIAELRKAAMDGSYVSLARDRVVGKGRSSPSLDHASERSPAAPKWAPARDPSKWIAEVLEELGIASTAPAIACAPFLALAECSGEWEGARPEL